MKAANEFYLVLLLIISVLGLLGVIFYVLALRYMQKRSEREPPAHNKSLH